MDTITGVQSSEARRILGLSQAAVARETGVNRAYISQFESGKMVLKDAPVQALAAFYVSAGWMPEDSDAEPQRDATGLVASPHRVVDGYVVAPSDVPYAEEALFGVLHRCSEQIESELDRVLPRDFFGGLDEDRALQAAAPALALAFVRDRIIGILHGTWMPEPSGADMEDLDSIETVGDFINALLASKVPDWPGVVEDPDYEAAG